MSDINLDFTVSNNSINFTVEPNEITITPTDIQLTFNPSIQPAAGGNIGELQYNNGSILGGVPTAVYSAGNLSLGPAANLKITGGTNGYVLQTDGTGNLDWAPMSGGGGGNGTPGGSNTQVQYNDSGLFGGNVGFTFNEITGLFTSPYLAGNGNSLSNITGANVTGQVPYAAIANSVAGANVSGAVAYATIANSVAGANVSGAVNLATYATTANAVAGANVSGTVANATYAISAGSATTAGTVTTNAQPNITSVGTLTSLKISSNTIALANNAGNSGQLDKAIAIGWNAGFLNQGANAIAFGSSAGGNNQAESCIAIGRNAGSTSQKENGIAIGVSAGSSNQGSNSIAIGRVAGQFSSGNNAIAIGYAAGQTSQANNSIIINATGVALDQTVANTFTVKPIRNLTQGNLLYYNSTSGEITYDAGTGGSNTAAGVNTQVQFNTANVLDASANFTFDPATNNLTVAGNIIGTHYGNGFNLTGVQAATVTSNAQPNITSVGTLTGLNVTGNANITGFVGITGGNLTVTAGNLSVAGVIEGRGYVSRFDEIANTSGNVSMNVYGSTTLITTANATANYSLNITGISTALGSLECCNVRFIMQNDNSNTFILSDPISVDGTPVVTYMASGVSPAFSTKSIYDIQIIKTAANVRAVVQLTLADTQ